MWAVRMALTGLAASVAGVSFATSPMAECTTESAGSVLLECARPQGWRFSLDVERPVPMLEVVRLVAECDKASVPLAVETGEGIRRRPVASGGMYCLP